MIVLDSHVWVWWVHGDDRLTAAQREAISGAEVDVIGISADQIIVATARVYGCPLVTSDGKLLEYGHVATVA